MNSNANSFLGTRRTRLARDQAAAGIGQESGNSDQEMAQEDGAR